MKKNNFPWIFATITLLILSCIVINRQISYPYCNESGQMIDMTAMGPNVVGSCTPIPIWGIIFPYNRPTYKPPYIRATPDPITYYRYISMDCGGYETSPNNFGSYNKYCKCPGGMERIDTTPIGQQCNGGLCPSIYKCIFTNQETKNETGLSSLINKIKGWLGWS
jgi:hypothetical protein